MNPKQAHGGPKLKLLLGLTEFKSKLDLWKLGLGRVLPELFFVSCLRFCLQWNQFQPKIDFDSKRLGATLAMKARTVLFRTSLNGLLLFILKSSVGWWSLVVTLRTDSRVRL